MFFYYYLIFFICFLYIFVNACNVKNKQKVFIVLSFSILILISGIRGYECGGDLQHYLSNYPIIGKRNFHDIFYDRVKYGYVFSSIYKIAYSIDESPTCLLFLTSIINLSFIAIFIKKYSCNPFFSVFIYVTMAFYTNTFNSVRSSMALGLGLVIMRYIIERNFIKFFIGYIVALEIHQTFFPFLFLYFIYNKQLSFRYIIISISICYIISQALSSFMGYIATLAYIYDPGAYEDIGEAYSGGYSLLALLSGMAVGFYWLLKKENCINKETQLFIHCMVMASCIQAFATYYTVLQRVAMFFYIVVIALFPITIKNIKTPFLRTCSYGITVLLFMIYFQIFVMTPSSKYGGSNYQGTIPYKTYWEK